MIYQCLHALVENGSLQFQKISDID